MKLGIVIYSDHPETVWNACRLANFANNEGDQVKIFLMAKGVEAESLSSDQYDIIGLLKEFPHPMEQFMHVEPVFKIRKQDSNRTFALYVING